MLKSSEIAFEVLVDADGNRDFWCIHDIGLEHLVEVLDAVNISQVDKEAWYHMED